MPKGDPNWIGGRTSELYSCSIGLRVDSSAYGHRILLSVAGEDGYSRMKSYLAAPRGETREIARNGQGESKTKGSQPQLHRRSLAFLGAKFRRRIANIQAPCYPIRTTPVVGQASADPGRFRESGKWKRWGSGSALPQLSQVMYMAGAQFETTKSALDPRMEGRVRANNKTLRRV
ncbi:hypothetical protein B0H17DRAFT_1125134 [Mycena rosella]|uniref:Uncharacterized protein n=1 Tax=Mycena rosella TaxID=1033263 RepID=A0AAD7GX68_MYCRO|nr:hypothetical protein B0H17DRAFT_1125134 [Mycena rosella]